MWRRLREWRRPRRLRRRRRRPRRTGHRVREPRRLHRALQRRRQPGLRMPGRRRGNRQSRRRSSFQRRPSARSTASNWMYSAGWRRRSLSRRPKVKPPVSARRQRCGAGGRAAAQLARHFAQQGRAPLPANCSSARNAAIQTKHRFANRNAPARRRLPHATHTARSRPHHSPDVIAPTRMPLFACKSANTLSPNA